MARKQPHVVIIGAGFGGLAAARALAKADVRVSVVDKRNHHLFQPLLYQVATAGLSATDIAAPIRKLLSDQGNASVLMGQVTDIDAKRRTLYLGERRIGYDYLIIAAGVTNAYFGHDEWEKHAPGLKSLEEALDIRRRVLLAYEAAEAAPTEKLRKAYLRFAVIGGGPTGVELAGALREIAQRTMTRNFRAFDPTDASVVLLEGGPRLLPAMPEALSDRTASDLRELGVDVRLNTRALAIDRDAVTVTTSDAPDVTERIEAKTILWGAGVQGVPLAKKLGVALDQAGRVPVQSDLSVKGLTGVYVIGDLAAFTQKDGTLVPGVAPAAIQQGECAAKNIVRHISRDEPREFRYVDKGSMATIGRSRAVAVSGRMHLTGFTAWLAWLFVHLMALVGFRNRLMVLIEWAYAYFTFQRSARIVLGGTIEHLGDPADASADHDADGAPALREHADAQDDDGEMVKASPGPRSMRAT